MIEEWRDVKGFEGSYEISSSGSLRSIDRCINGRKMCGKILKPRKEKNGYLRTTITIGRNFRKTVSIHRLVADSFLPNPENLEQVNHIDGNKENNSKENLEWCTAKQNINHAVNIGLFENLSGSKCHLSKYTEEDIQLLIKLLSTGDSPSKISRKVKISRIMISRVNRGVAWRKFSEKLGITEFPINGVKR